MSQLPRLLPLIGVAIGGVLAANALQGARGVTDLMSARPASAEEAPAKARAPKNAAKPDTKAETAAKPDAPTPGSPLPGPLAAAAGGTRPPVCAQSPQELAKAAGLSGAELQILQNLQTRRGQIDAREKDLDTEVQLLGAAEAKLDGKLKSMNALKAEIQALMSAADQKSQKDIDNLVVVYSKMKPSEAAAVMAQLDDRVRLPIAAAMKANVLSQILGKMGTAEAKVLTERLAHRYAPLQAMSEAAKSGAPEAAAGASSAAAAPDAAAKPARRARPPKKVARTGPRRPAPKSAAGEDDGGEVKTRAVAPAPSPPAAKTS